MSAPRWTHRTLSLSHNVYRFNAKSQLTPKECGEKGSLGTAWDGGTARLHSLSAAFFASSSVCWHSLSSLPPFGVMLNGFWYSYEVFLLCFSPPPFIAKVHADNWLIKGNCHSRLWFSFGRSSIISSLVTAKTEQIIGFVFKISLWWVKCAQSRWRRQAHGGQVSTTSEIRSHLQTFISL